MGDRATIQPTKFVDMEPAWGAPEEHLGYTMYSYSGDTYIHVPDKDFYEIQDLYESGKKQEALVAILAILDSDARCDFITDHIRQDKGAVYGGDWIELKEEDGE